MTKWLASVKSLDEVKQLLPVLPDILDMKNPAEGALGALTVSNVTQIVKFVDRRCLSSATIGDLPMQAEIIAHHLQAMSESGVDFLKIGLFPDRNLSSCILALAATVKKLNQPVIGVLFADTMPEEDVIPQLAKAGFKGVMVDTAYKNGKGLLHYWTQMQIKQFVKAAKAQQMLCGLAGALRYDDIAILKPLKADYLGFRSALCQNHERTNLLDCHLAQEVSQAITR